MMLHSYLFAYVFWLGPGLGALGILMIFHLTGGEWGRAMRPALVASTRTLGPMAILFIPIALGVHGLYEWADPAKVAGDPELQAKAAYLNLPFFVIRAVVCLGFWIWLARAVTSDREDAFLRKVSGPGLAIYAVTILFVSTDWTMSLEPRWFSTMYGLVFMVGEGLTAYALALGWTALSPRIEATSLKGRRDLGNILLTFIVVWTYVSFMQFLVIWMGNLPDEVEWFTRRAEGGWGAIAAFLGVFQFFMPFFLLLFRDIKHRAGWLAALAFAVAGTRVFDVYWTVAPDFGRAGAAPRWSDPVMFVVLGAVWLFFFRRSLAHARSNE